MANSEKQILTTQQEAISSVESFLSEVRRVATNLRRVEKKGVEEGVEELVRYRKRIWFRGLSSCKYTLIGESAHFSHGL